MNPIVTNSQQKRSAEDDHPPSDTNKKSKSGNDQDNTDDSNSSLVDMLTQDDNQEMNISNVVDLLNRVPKVRSTNEKLTVPYYVLSNSLEVAQQVKDIIHQPVTYKMNLFRTLIQTSDDLVLLCILNKDEYKVKLEGLLNGLKVTYSTTNPLLDTESTRKVIIVGINYADSSKLTMSVLRTRLSDENAQLPLASFNVFKLRNKTKPVSAILRINDLSVYNNLIEHRELNAGASMLTVFRYCPLVICDLCGLYGHGKVECKASSDSPDLICLKCGEKGHGFVNCSSKSINCFYCTSRGDKSNHWGSAIHCNFRLDYMDMLSSKKSSD